MYKENMKKSAKKWGGVFLLSIFIPLLISGCEKKDIHIINEIIYLEPLKTELNKTGIKYFVSGKTMETYVSDREVYDQIFNKVINENIRIKIFTEDSAQQIIKNWNSSSLKYSQQINNDGTYVFLFAKANCNLALKGLSHTSIPGSICN